MPTEAQYREFARKSAQELAEMDRVFTIFGDTLESAQRLRQLAEAMTPETYLILGPTPPAQQERAKQKALGAVKNLLDDL